MIELSPRNQARYALIGLVWVLGLAFLVSFFPIEDSDDDWWQLKAGKLLWEGRTGWYSSDAFTLTAQDKVWVNHEWLAEMLFYGSTLLGGLQAANLFKALIVTATFLVVYLTCRKLVGSDENRSAGKWCAALAVGIAIPTSQFTLYLRPPVWSFLFVALYHFLLVRRAGKGSLREEECAPPGLQRLLVMVLLMILWASLHGGAILGCIIIGLMAAGAGLEVLAAWWKGEKGGVKRLGGWVAPALLVPLASLMNPYGFHLHSLTFEVMSEKWLTSRIYELVPPAFDLVWTIPLLLIPATYGIIQRGRWGESLVFLFLVWQGLSHVRHLPLLAIWSAPYAALAFVQLLVSFAPLATMMAGGLSALMMLLLSWGGIAGSFSHPLSRWVVLSAIILATLGLVFDRGARTRWLFAILAGIAIGFVVAVPGQRPQRFVRCMMGEAWSGRNFPDQICEFILKHHIQTPVLFARETGAGYPIWKLAPESMRVFSCSRFDLQGSLPVKELEMILWMHEQAWTDPETGVSFPGWEDLWNVKYHFDLVLMEKYADALTGRVFPFWNFLNRPDSGFVRLASERWPGPGPADRQFTLFLRKGEQLSRVMKEIGSPVWFEEKGGL
jgi:hypothetical protein